MHTAPVTIFPRGVPLDGCAATSRPGFPPPLGYNRRTSRVRFPIGFPRELFASLRSLFVKQSITRTLARTVVVAAVVGAFVQLPLEAQDRLKTMPGYARYERMARESPSAVRSGALNVTWID